MLVKHRENHLRHFWRCIWKHWVVGCPCLPVSRVFFRTYLKIPKASPGAYIFQRPFLRGLYLRREVCVSKSIGLALWLEGNLPVSLCFTLHLRAISKYKPPGGLYLEGRINVGFFALRVWGAYIWTGLFSEFYGSFAHLWSRSRRCQLLSWLIIFFVRFH